MDKKTMKMKDLSKAPDNKIIEWFKAAQSELSTSTFLKELLKNNLYDDEIEKYQFLEKEIKKEILKRGLKY